MNGLRLPIGTQVIIYATVKGGYKQQPPEEGSPREIQVTRLESPRRGWVTGGGHIQLGVYAGERKSPFTWPLDPPDIVPHLRVRQTVKVYRVRFRYNGQEHLARPEDVEVVQNTSGKEGNG